MQSNYIRWDFTCDIFGWLPKSLGYAVIVEQELFKHPFYHEASHKYTHIRIIYDVFTKKKFQFQLLLYRVIPIDMHTWTLTRAILRGAIVVPVCIFITLNYANAFFPLHYIDCFCIDTILESLWRWLRSHHHYVFKPKSRYFSFYGKHYFIGFVR